MASKRRPPRQGLPILIDCDPGIDDAIAIFLAAASPELSLLGITTVAGNRAVEVTTRNALALLELAGRPEVPVHAGCARPLLEPVTRLAVVHGDDGVGGVPLPAPGRTAGEAHGVDFLIDTLRREPAGSVTLVAIGPLTNLAMAAVKAPDALPRLKELVIMGGAAFGPGNITPVAEFNFWFDPAAAHVVTRLGLPTAIFGLDVTLRVCADASRRKRLHGLGNRCGVAAARMIESYAAAETAMHDPCTIAWLLDRSLFRGPACQVGVDYRPGPGLGQSIAACLPRHLEAGRPVTTTVMREADDAGFFRLLEERLARLP